MATPRKRRPSFDAPSPAAPATPEAPAWAYRTDPTAPAAPPVRTVSSSVPSSVSSTPSVLNRIVTTPLMLATLIVLMPLSLFGRSAKPR